MVKNFVPFELSVKLKELGFKEECFARWFKVGEEKPIFLYNTVPSSENGDIITIAPLWQQAYQYLFEKSGKYIIPIPCDDENIGKWYALGKPYQTYEEARLACLQELIKIVETWNTQKK